MCCHCEGGFSMARYFASPSIVEAVGNKPKIIEEFIGSVNSLTREVSIARMTSPSGWVEPGQSPDFTEYTLVLKGCLRVTLRDQSYDVGAGQAIIVEVGEWVQYSTPDPGGAEYIAVCLPAFTPETVNRDK